MFAAMSESSTLRLHESLRLSQSAFHKAASTPLLGPSTLPHPALGNVFTAAANGGHVTAAVMASMQQTLEQVVMRVAKLESLVFLLETERSPHAAGSQKTSSVNLFQDVRATLYETMEPVREQLRRHEAILLDLVQSLNHAAGWGYYKPSPHRRASGDDDIGMRSGGHSRPATSTSAMKKTTSAGDHHGGGGDALVMVSPLTKADTSHVTHGTTTLTAASVMPPIDPTTVNLEDRIARMRQLAGVLGTGAPLGSPSKQSNKRSGAANKQRNHDEVDSGESSSYSDAEQSPIRRHYHHTTADTSSTQPNESSGGGGTTTTTTFYDDHGRRVASTPSSSDHPHGHILQVENEGTDTNDEAKVLIHNVKKILRKTDAEDASTTLTTTSSSSLLQNHFSTTLLSTPQRNVRFGAVDDSLATPPPLSTHPQTHGSMFGGVRLHSDTTTTTTTSSSGGGGQHYPGQRTDLPAASHYRAGVQLLQSPGSTQSYQPQQYGQGHHPQYQPQYGHPFTARGIDFHQDSSSLSDGYQELLKRMHM